MARHQISPSDCAQGDSDGESLYRPKWSGKRLPVATKAGSIRGARTLTPTRQTTTKRELERQVPSAVFLQAPVKEASKTWQETCGSGRGVFGGPTLIILLSSILTPQVMAGKMKRP